MTGSAEKTGGRLVWATITQDGKQPTYLAISSKYKTLSRKVAEEVANLIEVCWQRRNGKTRWCRESRVVLVVGNIS